jgi:group I intron endonuclease
MKISGIYKIQNKINNKVYIGSSIDVSDRWKQHIRELKSKYHHNQNLQNAWHDQGDKNFEFEVIEIVEDINKLIDREQYYIDLTKCYDSNYGYNVSPKAGSCLGVKRTEKEKRWLSKVNSGERSCQAKIKEKDAIKICERIVRGESINLIAKDYSKGIVSAIKHGKTWKHISKDYIDHFPRKSIKIPSKINETTSKTNKLPSKSKQKSIIEEIHKLYMEFIDSVSEHLVLPKHFVKELVNDCKDMKLNAKEKEILKVKSNKSDKYLFSGLITCSDCSKKFRGQMSRKSLVYICLGYHNKTSDCKRFSVHEKDILSAIGNYLSGDQIDLNLISSINVKSKEREVKIYYMDGSCTLLQP